MYILKVYLGLNTNVKLPSDKRNSTKNVLFLLLLASAHHSFTFNWQSLYVK